MTMQLTVAFWVFFLVCPQLASSQILKTVSQDNSLVKYASAADEMPGICREIAAAVMAYDASLSFQGLDQPVPLTRIEKMLESGIIDVFFCFLRNRDREARFRYIDVPLYTVRHVLLAKADDPIDIKNFSDLHRLEKQNIVLVNFGSSLVQHLNDAAVRNNASAKNDVQLLRMLESGRGRFIYGQDLTLLEMLRRMRVKERYRILPTVFKEEHQYLAYHRNLNPAVVLKLEKAIRALSISGQLEKLVNRYRL